MDIEITIDELVLHGFPPGDRDRIGEGLQAELARLFARERQPQAWIGRGDIPYLDGGRFQMAPGAGPETVGAQVAGAIHRGVTK